MFACVDVYYHGNQYAVSACVYFKCANDASPALVANYRVDDVQPYVPGRFFERELPCLLKVLAVHKDVSLSAIIVDGYVWLDEARSRPGLGAHLYHSLSDKIPVIGVSKTRFHDDNFSTAVTRGTSKTPLWVTSAGMEQEAAAEFVRSMAGEHRIPALLKQVDRLSRELQ